MENGLCWEGNKSIWMETKGNHINEKWLHASSEDGKMKMNSRYFGDKQDWWLSEKERVKAQEKVKLPELTTSEDGAITCWV